MTQDWLVAGPLQGGATLEEPSGVSQTTFNKTLRPQVRAFTAPIQRHKAGGSDAAVLAVGFRKEATSNPLFIRRGAKGL